MPSPRLILATLTLTLAWVTIGLAGGASAHGAGSSPKHHRGHGGRVCMISTHRGHRRRHCRPRLHAKAGRHLRALKPAKIDHAAGEVRRAIVNAASAPRGATPGTTGSSANVPSRACADTELIPDPGNLALIRAATLCLVNQERARHGELPLQANSKLEAAAQGHSDDMVARDYFDHISPEGLTPLGRIQATGYIPGPEVGYALGENIAWGTLSLATPAAMVAAWIASPEHLANILKADYRDGGLGIAPAAPGSLAGGQPGAVYTQEFGVIIR